MRSERKDLIGMYFDAEVVFVTKSSLLFRLAILCLATSENWYTTERILGQGQGLKRKKDLKWKKRHKKKKTFEPAKYWYKLWTGINRKC